MKKATFGSRAIAWFGDLLVMVALATIISFIFGSAVGLTGGRDSSFMNFLSVSIAIIWGLSLFFLQFLYFGYFWSKDGQSFGMKWLHTRVVRRNKEDSISFLRAGLRGSFGYWLSGLILYIGYLWAIWDKDSETWHDKLFDTWVVQA